MNAKVEVLYREIEGCGDDSEAENPDGVLVTLSKWERDENQDFRVRDHYVVEKIVLVDRTPVIHEFEYIDWSWTRNADAEVIRKAIAEFDKLVSSHPAFGENFKG